MSHSPYLNPFASQTNITFVASKDVTARISAFLSVRGNSIGIQETDMVLGVISFFVSARESSSSFGSNLTDCYNDSLVTYPKLSSFVVGISFCISELLFVAEI